MSQTIWTEVECNSGNSSAYLRGREPGNGARLRAWRLFSDVASARRQLGLVHPTVPEQLDHCQGAGDREALWAG